MLGTVGNVSNTNRKGGFSIVQKIDNRLSFKVLSGSKILCTDCEVDNETSLISDGSIEKTTEGYNILKDLEISVIKPNTTPLTILRGREIVFVDGVISGSNMIFNLPKGARVNQTVVGNSGEFSIAASTKYLIEY